MLKNFKSITEDWIENQRRNPKSKFRALTICKMCHSFYYKKSWHFERPEYLDDYTEQEVPVRFTECPACMEQELALYDAEMFPVLGKV